VEIVCKHRDLKVEPVWDRESGRILVAWVCSCGAVVQVWETWCEYLRRCGGS